MARLAAVLLLLAACAAPARRGLKAPGLELTVREGKWLLLVLYSYDGTDKPAVVFDENGGPDDLPPAAPVRLPKRGFDARALPPAVDRPDSYHEMVAGDRARGIRYLHQRERGEAYPLMWWGLPDGHRLDETDPREALAEISRLFGAKRP